MLGETSVDLEGAPLSPVGRAGTLTSTRTAFADGAVICSSGFLFTPATALLFALNRDRLVAVAVAAASAAAAAAAAAAAVVVGAFGLFDARSWLMRAEEFCVGAWFCFEPPMDPRREVKDCKWIRQMP
jgi:hypothetical protein